MGNGTLRLPSAPAVNTAAAVSAAALALITLVALFVTYGRSLERLDGLARNQATIERKVEALGASQHSVDTKVATLAAQVEIALGRPRGAHQ